MTCFLGTNFLIVETFVKNPDILKNAVWASKLQACLVTLRLSISFLALYDRPWDKWPQEKAGLLFCQPHHHLILYKSKMCTYHENPYGLLSFLGVFTAKLLSLMKTYSVILWVVKIYFNLENKMPFIF